MAETVFFLIDLYTRHHMPQNNFSCKCIYSQAGNNVPDRLANAYGSFRQWCKNMHATPAVKHFTKENLGWTSMAKFPDCSFKGSDTRLLLGWLLNFMEEPNVVLDEVATNACVAAKAIDDFLRLCFGNKDAQGCRKILLTQEEAILCLSMLKVYLDQFTFLARTCFNQAKQFFNYTPKFHYLMHVAFDLEQQILRSGKDEKNYVASVLCDANGRRRDWSFLQNCKNMSPKHNKSHAGWPKSGSSLAYSRGTTTWNVGKKKQCMGVAWDQFWHLKFPAIYSWAIVLALSFLKYKDIRYFLIPKFKDIRHVDIQWHRKLHPQKKCASWSLELILK